MITMIERFQGDDGKPRLIEVLRRQKILHDNEALAEELAERAELVSLKANEVLIEQGGTDNDIYFILAGTLSVSVNGREIAVREPGQHVGEMALIDTMEARCATVSAAENVVVAKASEATFSSLADKFPRLWRLLANELCARLRQRNQLVTTPNPTPVLFIGSSVEGLAVANQIQMALYHEKIIVKVWTDQIFGASNFAIEDLQEQVKSADFAVLVVTPDDHVVSRKHEHDAPRDNVIFELGLFMGALTRQRTFLLTPHGTDLKIPSDLLGLTPLSYKAEPKEHLASGVGPASTALETIIKNLGPK